MTIYTSRFSNPELRKGCYTAVKISLGSPRWNLGYRLDGDIKDLMPYGLLGKYDDDSESFRREYCSRLDRVGVQRIMVQLRSFEDTGKDVVLLCYEDIRKEGYWCHRSMFADWWRDRTGQIIEELSDSKQERKGSNQLHLFD
jgi:hypothetical protein